MPSKNSSPQLHHTSFSIVVEKLTTPKQFSTQSSSPEHTNSNKESTPIEKISGSSKSKLFISINDQLGANFDRFTIFRNFCVIFRVRVLIICICSKNICFNCIFLFVLSSVQKNYCHANSSLTLSPSISLEDKSSFHPNRTRILSPSVSVEDKRSLHASVENKSPLNSNATEVVSPPILHDTQYSCLVKPQSPPRSPMATNKIDVNPNIQSLTFRLQSEQAVGYCSVQIPNITQDKYDYTTLTKKENKTGLLYILSLFCSNSNHFIVLNSNQFI